MKIRTQLIGLVTGAAALFLLSVGAYFAILSPLDAMQKEVGVFQEMTKATSDLQTQANQLLLNPLAAQKDEFDKATDRFHNALAGMKSVVLLPKVNETLAAAVSATATLGGLSDSSLHGLTDLLDEIKTVCENAHLPFDSTDWPTLFRLAISKQISNAPEVMFVAANMTSQLSALNQALTVTRQVLEQKDGEIAQELGKVRANSSLVGLAVIVIAVALTLTLSVVLARRITRSLKTLGSTVSRVGEGDLRVRFASARKDELGALGHDIDGFLDTLTVAFRRIQAASAENLSIKNQLVESVGSATASAVQIEANSSSILAQLQRADERIQSSQRDLSGVVTLLEAFLRRLDEQAFSVATASRVVSELTRGIAEISGLSNKNKLAGESLRDEAEQGRQVFDNSFGKVAEIGESVEAIQELVGTIANVASQTNILAMNAAIEAAHAGEAGKGFSVVADEISKLAAASADSSAMISSTIETVVAKIREAGATREETLRTFESISAQIEAVSADGLGIYNQTNLMNQGAATIRDVMTSLDSSAAQTRAEAQNISAVASSLGETLGQVGRISHEVVSNIGEITLGLTEISRTVGEVQAQSDRLGRAGNELDEAVNAFQTEDEPAVEEAGSTPS